MITYTNCISPYINQHFDAMLLHTPCAKFYDDSEVIWRIYQYILSITYKLLPNQMDKYQTLEKQFLELYGRAKAKEEELKAKDEYTREMCSYLSAKPNERNDKLLGRIKYNAPKKARSKPR